MCHRCHITKWEALTFSGQTPSGPSRDAALATSSIEACGWTWQRGFAQKIPRRAIKAFSIPRRRHECKRGNRHASVVIFIRKPSNAVRDCPEASPGLPCQTPLHTQGSQLPQENGSQEGKLLLGLKQVSGLKEAHEPKKQFSQHFLHCKSWNRNPTSSL